MRNCTNPHFTLSLMLFQRKIIIGNVVLIGEYNTLFVCMLPILKYMLIINTLKAIWLCSWFPHAFYIFSEEVLHIHTIPPVLPVMSCKSTLLSTPLLILLYDRRLRIRYYKTYQRDLTLEENFTCQMNDTSLFKIYDWSFSV